MSETETDAIRGGTLLAGKYRVEKVLGEGGMGFVVAAEHVYLHEEVAIKLLRGDRTGCDRSGERLMREARAASRIRSEHVARVFDVGLLEDGAPYIVMERLRGKDLAAVLDQEGPLRVPTAVDYLLQACEAMAEAHVLGIVHRDLKPANLFLTRRMDGSACIKVLDFGISKMTRTGPTPAESSPPSARPARWDAQTVDPPDSAPPKPRAAAPRSGARDMGSVSLTGTDARVGSPRYMSPEQLRGGREIDGRSDIWSLGVILYELVTGVPAFLGATQEELEAAILDGEPTPIGTLDTKVPHELEQAVTRCLRKDPAERPADVASFATALAPLGTSSARSSAARIAKIAATNREVPDGESPKPDVFAVTQARPAGPSRAWRAPATIATTAAGVILMASVIWIGRAPAPASTAAAAAPSAPIPMSAEPAASTAQSPAPGPTVDRSPPPTPPVPARSRPAPKRAGAAPAASAPTASAAPSTAASSLHLDPGNLFDGRK
jgi:serine/threonine-protein kinase